jgi:hypothetical protein
MFESPTHDEKQESRHTISLCSIWEDQDEACFYDAWARDKTCSLAQKAGANDECDGIISDIRDIRFENAMSLSHDFNMKRGISNTA